MNTKLLARLDKPTVLVTGGLGFIGSHVVEDLIKNDMKVVILDDMSNGSNFNKDAEAFLLRDITLVGTFDVISHEIDYIVHLAAAISVAESMLDPEKYKQINEEGSINVFNWARDHNVKRVVVASSAAVYGHPKVEDIPLAEASASGGISPYANTKFAMEEALKLYATKHKLRGTALRFFNVYGPRQDPKSEYSGVISLFLDRAKAGKDIPILGDGLQYRDFIYVKDVARAIRLSMLSARDDYSVFNVCTGKQTRIKDLAEIIGKVFGSSSCITYEPERPGDVKQSLGNPGKAANELHFQSEYDLEKGLTKTKEWFDSI